MKSHNIHQSINSKKEFVSSSVYITNEHPDMFCLDKKYIVIYHTSRFDNNGNMINPIDRNKAIMKQTRRNNYQYSCGYGKEGCNTWNRFKNWEWNTFQVIYREYFWK